MTFKAGVSSREPLPAPGSSQRRGLLGRGVGDPLRAVQREETGAGQLLDISLNEALAQTSDWSLPNCSVRNALGFEGTDVRNGSGPVYPIFRCRDGYVRLIVLSTPQWRAMRAWLGEPEYLQDEEYDTFPGRLRDRRRRAQPALRGALRRHERRDRLRAGPGARHRVHPVLDPARVLTNEHFASRGTFMDLEVGSRRRGPRRVGLLRVRRRAGRAHAPRPVGGRAHRAGVLGAGGGPRPAAPLPAPSLPLTGLRVMDFGQGAVGVEAGKLFAEYGADVLKIESRAHYDFIRVITGIEMGPSFASSSRSKRGFGVNARTPEGKALLHQLAKLSDVVIENVTTGAMDDLGHRLRRPLRRQPRDHHGREPAHGLAWSLGQLAGLRAEHPGAGGLSYLWSYEGDDEPAGTASIFPDHFVGRLCAVGALATLIGRRRGTVQGGLVEVAQCEAVTGVLSDLLAAESLEPGSVGPRGIHTERGTPGGHVPVCRRGRVGRHHLPRRRRLGGSGRSPRQARAGRRPPVRHPGRPPGGVDEVDGLVGSWTGGLDRFEVADRCQAAGVPAGAMLHSRDLASNEHLVARGFPVPVDQPAVGTILFEGPAFFGPAIAPPVEEPAPWLGEHTEEIGIELLGLDPAEVQRLIEAGVLEITPARQAPGLSPTGVTDTAFTGRASAVDGPPPPAGRRRTAATAGWPARTGATAGGPGPTGGRRDVRGPTPDRWGSPRPVPDGGHRGRGGTGPRSPAGRTGGEREAAGPAGIGGGAGGDGVGRELAEGAGGAAGPGSSTGRPNHSLPTT